MKKEKIVLGMSGGVDSSVAALLLKKKGFEVCGVFMKNWDDENAICSAEDDYADALSVCNQLKISLKKINYTKEYKERVFNQFLDDHQNGFTPNPDVLCNKEIKFDVFQKYAKEIGASKIASGHYAKIVKADEKFFICKAIDSSKDQSYFLYQLTSQILESVVFPLGDVLKKDIRKIAQENNLINASKKDSTGICFIGDRQYNNFVRQFLKSNKGKIVTVDGEEIGTHNGHMYFTVGQRKGLGIGARESAFDQPWYVVNKDIDNNIVYVAQGSEHPALFSDELIARVFEASATFFLSDTKNKMRSAYLSAEENFGYQAFASEHLDPASPADLKETFTMRNILNATIEENRWPSVEFKELMQLFFAEL
mgnify:CR=1 FL=1